MPVYEYQCTACGHEFEREQRISEDPIKKCPKCGKAKAKRLISRTSFVLKGGGWYGDLYASAKPGDAKKDEGGAATGAEKSGNTASEATASESKSEPKSESKSESKGEKKAEKKSKGKKSAA